MRVQRLNHNADAVAVKPRPPFLTTNQHQQPMKTENHVAEIYLGYTIIKIKRVFHVTHPAVCGTTIFPNINVAKQWIETQNLETVDIDGVPCCVCVHPDTREPLKTITADDEFVSEIHGELRIRDAVRPRRPRTGSPNNNTDAAPVNARPTFQPLDDRSQTSANNQKNNNHEE